MQVGEVIAGRFELVSVAGEGGMGVVFRAYDRETGREVALKTMLRADAEDTARFRREAQVLRELSHPGIVLHVADGVSEAGELWLAMEWVEGEDLRARLRRGPLEIEEAVALGVELSESLSALHAKRVVHRDLKPGNVRLLRGAGRRSKLLDFGTVRSLESAALHEERTSAGVLVGTPGYVSPEQARGEPLDARSDLFSLGVLLYACVSGTSPFRGANLVATLAKVVLEDPPLLRARRPECPYGLERLVARLLEKDPSRRPASAEEVARALEALAGEPAPEPDSSSGVLRAREQRFACVLMARPTAPRGPDETDTLAGGRTLRPSAPPSVFESLVEGARHEMLRDGTKVFVWSGEGTASDIARRAAGASLALAPLLGPSATVLASGRASVDEALPVGEAVDRAATLLSATRAAVMGQSSSNSVFVDENVARLVEESFEVRSEGRRRWLVGERTGPAGARTLLGRATPCVGREVELSVLDLTLSAVLDEGNAAAVVLTGEMGVGKSRVRQEWVRALAARRPEALVCQAHADVMHERAAYGIASRLVRDGCGVPFGASAEHVRRAIFEAVKRVVEETDRRRIASRLSELCGAPWDEDVDEALVTARGDAIVMGDQLRAAWEDFLVASCRERAVVLVVENLQWADGPSLALLDRALRNFGDRTWMVLGLGRPEHRDKHPKLWGERGVREQVLGPLKDKPAERLVRAVLGTELSEDRVKRLVTKAAGNPYFLEELLRAEAEGQGDSTPDTVLAMVEARLLRLEPALRRILRAASVYGGRFDTTGLEAVLGEASPRASLEALEAREWLIAVEGGGYGFRQATSREAAYAMLVEEDKRLAHARAAEHLTSHAGDAVAIAEHHERAQAPERAAPWWAKAATQALEANDFAGAVARAEAAERCGARGDELAEALLARAEAHSWRNENPALRETAERFGAVATSLEHEAEALRWRALGALRAGDGADLTSALARAREVAVQHPDHDSVVFCGFRIATSALYDGLVAQADALAALLEAAEPPLERRSGRLLGARARWRAYRAGFAHDDEHALALHREAAEFLRSVGDVRNAALEEANGGYPLLMLGAYEEASEVLDASLRECRRLGLASLAATNQHNLGLALLGLGRFEPALLAEREAVEAFVAGGDTRMEAISRDYLARILVASGRPREAAAEAERALALLDVAHPFALSARASLADALLVRGDPGDLPAALDHARAAREALRQDPARFEEPAFILRVHLDALEANGLEDEAQQAREEARAWARERAGQIRSEHYRRTFEGALDVARISKSPRGSGAE